MSASKEEKKDNIQFSWGKKKGVGVKKGIQFYESFTYDGMEYFLYDSICLYKHGVNEPYIGKLIKIWEQPGNKKRIKVLWFFHASEIHMYMGENTSAANELFLATGEGPGVCNVNPLEVLAGKCFVVCTSKDERNRQPSLEELKMADFIFYRTFDTGTNVASEKFENTIAGVGVEYLFNQKEQKFDALIKKRSDGIIENFNSEESPKVLEETMRPAKLQKFDSHDYNGSAVRKSEEMSKIKMIKDSPRVDIKLENTTFNKNQLHLSDAKKEAISMDMGRETDRQPVEVTKRPENDRSKWFADMPWDEKIQSAHELGRLVMLDNLDPELSQAEVEDIMYHAVKQSCSVRLIERSTFTDLHHGQALVVFKSSDAADIAVQKLNRDILLLPNGRPLLAAKGITRPPGKKKSELLGLLSVDKFTKLKKIREEMRKAASASHYSQPNTIEYEMAMEWMLLMHRSRRWWEELQEAHRREMNETRKNLKIK